MSADLELSLTYEWRGGARALLAVLMDPFPLFIFAGLLRYGVHVLRDDLVTTTRISSSIRAVATTTINSTMLPIELCCARDSGLMTTSRAHHQQQ
jgi:hypothetical protein